MLAEARTGYLVLHYTPSLLTLRHALQPVLFPACRDPLLRRDQADLTCAYSANRLAKVGSGLGSVIF